MVFFTNTGQCIYELTVGVEEHGLSIPPLRGQKSDFCKHCPPALLTNFGRMWSAFSSNEGIHHLAENIQHFTGWYPLLNKDICFIKVRLKKTFFQTDIQSMHELPKWTWGWDSWKHTGSVRLSCKFHSKNLSWEFIYTWKSSTFVIFFGIFSTV